jgi:S1-C subfamily serine protease
MSMMQTPEEPPEQEPIAASERPPRGLLRAPVAAGLTVAILAAFGGAAIAHFAWPSSSSSTSNPNGSIVTPQSNSLAPATTASSGHVSRGLVDVNTITDQGPAAGTGMVVTPNGEVITNNHVIAGATQISVYDVGNHRTYSAHVVGYARSRDIAVIQLTGASGLATVPIGDSSTVRVGASIVTIGNAGGVGGTPSSAGGSVSGVGRPVTASDSIGGTTEHLTGLIEISGQLEPGDSGGPLVSGAGRVIGMDTAASSSFSFQTTTDAGFAIPINTVLRVAREILAGDASNTIHLGSTALIGIEIENVAGNAGQGALVNAVVPGGPADTAGITAGSTITALDGHSVSSPDALVAVKDRHHPGDRVAVSWTDAAGGSHTASLVLTTGPAD